MMEMTASLDRELEIRAQHAANLLVEVLYISAPSLDDRVDLKMPYFSSKWLCELNFAWQVVAALHGTIAKWGQAPAIVGRFYVRLVADHGEGICTMFSNF